MYLPTYTYTPILVSVIAISVHGRELGRSRAAFISHVSEAARAAGEQARSKPEQAPAGREQTSNHCGRHGEHQF